MLRLAVMNIIKPRGLFITGTDTGVGKTYVACCIVRALVEQGKRVGVYKPAASGCILENERLVSDDALALWEAAGRPGTLDAVCPQRFAAPLAPHLAARQEGRQIDSVLLRSGLGYWQQSYDFVIVEGAGGYLSPLGDNEYVADLAHAFGYPLIIVAPNTLGVINQTLQTLLATSVYRGGLPVAGIVLNEVRAPDVVADPSILTNRHELERHAKTAVLAAISFGGTGFDRAVPWDSLPAYIVTSPPIVPFAN